MLNFNENSKRSIIRAVLKGQEIKIKKLFKTI